MTSRFGFKLGAALLLSLFALAPASAVMAQDVLSETVKRLEKKFASAQETLEYHLMLRVPNTGTKEPEKIIDALKESLGPIVKLDAPSGPKTVAYLDSPSRTLGKSNLVVRIRPGQLTIKVRSTSLHNLIDLKACNTQKNKYEVDYFEETGYSISAEHRFKKGEWLPDPTKATVGETMEFMAKHCPELNRQLAAYLSPLAKLSAPGTALIYTANATFSEPTTFKIKDTDLAFWNFPGTSSMLIELAWKGDAKDKKALEQHYLRTKARLYSAGLLANDQSPKTEQYFTAYFGKK